MAASGRTKKSLFNVLTGFFGQIFSFILSFVIRTVFIETLREEYLGLNGLFTNILSVLNLTELGLGTAIVIELYRTIANKDEEKTRQYLYFYQKAYAIIGVIILAAGLILTPFLQVFIKDFGSLQGINYRLVFLLYLFNTVFSYFFFAYRECIVIANQQEYRYRIITYIFKFLEMILQIITLFIFKNIYVYLIIPIFLGCVSTIVKGVLCGKWFPFILKKPSGKLSKSEVKATARNIYSVALYKFSGTILNSTDNIILSSFIDIIITGRYSNYLIIVSALKTILSKIFNAFTASLGNLNVEAGEDLEKKYKIFNVLSFLNFWAYGFCAICLYVCFTPFVKIWIGEKFVMNHLTEAIIAINFLIFGLQETVGLHRGAYGLFYQGRFRPIFTVILNIGLSILFVKILPGSYGVVAVLLGTIISNLLVAWWFDALIVHKHAFKKSPKKYYITYWLKFLYVCGFGALVKYITSLLPLTGFVSFIVNALICLVVFNIPFILLFRKTNEFTYFMDAVKSILKRKKASAKKV